MTLAAMKAPAGRGAGTPAASTPAPHQAAPGPLWRAFAQRRTAGGSSCCGPRAAGASPLHVGAADDVYEREAEHVATRLLAARLDGGAAAKPRPLHPSPGLETLAGSAQRRCTACEEEDDRPAAQRQATPGAQGGPLPDAARPALEALRGTGQALPGDVRAEFEQRLGVDLGPVRVHTGPAADTAARSLGAEAFTLGRDVVFGAGRYAPRAETGRSLLAHELVHVVQQSGGAPAGPGGAPVSRLWDGIARRVQRACVKSACPPVPVPIDALFPRWEAAEKCIQEQYAASHPASKRGVSLSFNADWVHLTGGTPQEKLALGCARGVETPAAGMNVTGKSGMFAAAPDIWDLRNTTMYEITTASGAPFRVGKLGAEIAQANSICGTAECGGLHFDRGAWSPDSGCYALGGELYFSAFNNQGVIVYNLIKDGTKELALATLLALLAASMKANAPKAAAAVGARAVGTRVLGKAVPAYAVASLAAMAVLLASGKAEAKLGPGSEEPLLQLFEALEKKGQPVPDEIKEMIEANPDLKAKLEAAMKEGGDVSKAQEELNRQILDTIAKNKDQFTAEELEVLLATTRAAGQNLPKGDMTVEELKKLAAAAKAGKTGDGSGAQPGDGGPAPVTPPVAADPGADKTDAAKGPDPAAAPTLSQAARDKLAQAPAPVRDLLSSMLGSGPDAKKLSDADLERFLAIVPADLGADKLAKLRERLAAATGKSVSEILDTLQKALAELDQPAAAPDPNKPDAGQPDPAAAGAAAQANAAPPPATATLTTEPTGAGAPADRQKLIDELAAKAKKESFKNVGAGQYRVTWTPDKSGTPAVGSTIVGTLRGKLADGTGYVGRVEAEVTSASGRNLKIKFITVTPMVGAKGQVVFDAKHFLGREDSVVLDPPKSKKK